MLQLLDRVSVLFPCGKKSKDKEEVLAKEADFFLVDRQAADGAGVAQTKVSTALMPMNCGSWSITTTPSSPSADIVSFWACTDAYRPSPVRESTLWIMAKIAALYLEDLCSGSRRMMGYLAREGIPNRRDLLRNLMCRMRFTGDPPEPPNHSSSTSIRAVSLPCGCHHDPGF